MTDTVDTRYLDRLLERLQWIRDNQQEQISQAAEICADTIANDGLVFSFGTGHGSFAARAPSPDSVPSWSSRSP